MANTPNIDLVKPAGTDHALVSVLNANSDKIDTFAGTTNAAITNISVNTQHMTDGTIISDLDNIPVGTQGRVKLASALRPNNNASLYDYNCHGEGTTRTLIVSSEYYKSIWVNYKNGSTWSGWEEFAVGVKAAKTSITWGRTLTVEGTHAFVCFSSSGYVLFWLSGSTAIDASVYPCGGTPYRKQGSSGTVKFGFNGSSDESITAVRSGSAFTITTGIDYTITSFC